MIPDQAADVSVVQYIENLETASKLEVLEAFQLGDVRLGLELAKERFKRKRKREKKKSQEKCGNDGRKRKSTDRRMHLHGRA